MAFGDYGSMPEVDDRQRIEAWGSEAELAAAIAAGRGASEASVSRPTPAFELTDDLRDLLGSVGVATLSVQLRKRGYTDVFLEGVHANRPGARVVGRARTLRFVPFRPDLFARRGGGYNAQKLAFDTVGPGEVLVIDARGERGTGTVGDVLALRAQVRGAAGIVTDGGTRDFDVVAALDIPTFSQGPHPSVLGRRHVPWEVDVAIACGGAAVRARRRDRGRRRRRHRDPARTSRGRWPAKRPCRRRRTRGWPNRSLRGASVDGLFPMNAEWRARYEAESHRRGQPMTRREQVAAGLRLHPRAHRRRSLRAGLPAGARPDREGARRLGRARARGDPPARGRGARDLRAQRRRAGRAHQGDRVPAHHADARRSSRARPPRCRRRISRRRSSIGRATVNERMRRTLDDFDPHRFTELNLEFHSVLFEECPNPHILDLVHRGWNRMRMLRDSSFSFVPGRARESVAEHDRIVDLIEADADPLEIELAARRHRTATLDAMLAYQAQHKPPASTDAATRRTPAAAPPPRRPAPDHDRPTRRHAHDASHPRWASRPHPPLHRREVRRLGRRRDLRRARPGLERDVRAGGGGTDRPTSTSRSPPRAARSPTDRGRGCSPAPAPASCTASPTSSRRRMPGWPSSRPSTPACRSRRRSGRRSAPPRTSGSSPT